MPSRLLSVFNVSALFASVALVTGCSNSTEENAVTLTQAQKDYIKSQLDSYDLSRYNEQYSGNLEFPAGTDWFFTLRGQDGYRGIHQDPVNLPIDFDTLDQGMTLAFLLGLDPHRLIRTAEKNDAQYFNHYRLMRRRILNAGEDPEAQEQARQSYHEDIIEYLIEEHGFTREHIEVIYQIGQGVLQKAEDANTRIEPVAPDPEI